MRCLERNKVQFSYCPYIGKTKVTDASGYETGEYKVSYGSAISVMGNVSPAQGEAQIEQFGNALEYDKVIILEDRNFPMDENSVLFVDKAPAYDQSGNPLYDYIVKNVARSLNGVSYAISKVTVS